jgi:glutathione S-transferase
VFKVETCAGSHGEPAAQKEKSKLYMGNQTDLMGQLI